MGIMASTKVAMREAEVLPGGSDQTTRLVDEAQFVHLHDYPTVLVVRDDDGLAGLLVDCLRSEDYNVLETDSAHVLDAVRVHSRPIHLLLVDESMNSHVPILKTFQSELQVVFVKKPINLEAILARVRKLLGSPPSPSSIR
jgi:hypothetical protein